MFKAKKLIVVLLMTGFLVSCGPKSVSQGDGNAMASLMSLFFLCQSLAKEDSKAECTIINLENYGVLEKTGIKLSPEVDIQIAITNHELSAIASFVESKELFHMNSKGKITPLTS